MDGSRDCGGAVWDVSSSFWQQQWRRLLPNLFIRSPSCMQLCVHFWHFSVDSVFVSSCATRATVIASSRSTARRWQCHTSSFMCKGPGCFGGGRYPMTTRRRQKCWESVSNSRPFCRGYMQLTVHLTTALSLVHTRSGRKATGDGGGCNYFPPTVPSQCN